MLARLTALALPCLLGSYCLLHAYPIALTNPYLGESSLWPTATYPPLPIQNPQYSILIFKSLLKLQLIDHDPHLSPYLLTGFDLEGTFIN